MWSASGWDEQLHERPNGVHPVEHVQRLAQVHQHKPGREAVELFPQAVLKLRMGPERWDHPQLDMGKTKSDVMWGVVRLIQAIPALPQQIQEVEWDLKGHFIRNLVELCF